MRFATVLLLYCLSVISTYAQSGKYERMWRRVYKFELNDRPKSALDVVDSIYLQAKLENNIVQITRSVLYQSKFAMILQADAEYYVVEKFKKEIRESSPPLKNLLESMLGSIYMEYWKRNRWEYTERSSINNPHEDFKLWSEKKIIEAIDQHFSSSLNNVTLLQAVDLSTIEELLALSDARVYRPTLYDLLAHRALEFYESDEHKLREFHTTVFKDEKLFASFGDAIIDTLVANEPVIRIYRDLYEFHKSRKDTTALIDLEINRLQWLAEDGDFEDPHELHKQALIQLKKDLNQHPVSAWIEFELAKIFVAEAKEFTQSQQQEQQFKYITALQYCDSVLTGFPNSEAEKKCAALKKSILIPALDIISEKYVPVQMPSLLLVKHKNIKSIRCTIFSAPYNFEQVFRLSSDADKQERIKHLRIDTAWAVNLKSLNDHQFHTTEIGVPPLAAGSYFILITIDGEPSYSYTSIQVTDIALLESELHGSVRYQVVNRNNGAPLQNAMLNIKTQRTVKKDSVNAQQVSDVNGFVKLSDINFNHNSVEVTVQHNGEEAVFNQYLSFPRALNEDDELEAKGFLMTDRRIYRPGQTVYFKGILMKTKRGKSEVAVNEYVKILLNDPEYNELQSVRFKTNEFGSFTGEFILPGSGLTGEYILEMENDFEEGGELEYADFENVREEISVEEYKRPSFEIIFDALSSQYLLNDTIRVSGKVMSFSGASLAGATVKYQIERETYHYYGKRKRRSREQDKIYASGQTHVNTKGEFLIPFFAAAFEDLPREEKPIMFFNLTVNVTDITGETRTHELNIRTGYHSFKAELIGPDKIEQLSSGAFSINITNLNGQPEQTHGSVKVYKLSKPSGLYRDRPWGSPDLPELSREQFATLFPHEVYSENDIVPSKQLVSEIPFKKGQTSIRITPDLNWSPGEYEMELSAHDPSGLSVSDMHSFAVSEKDKLKPHTELLWVETDKRSYAVGDRVKISIGSAVPNITVTVDIDCDNQIISTYTQTLSGNVMELIIPTNLMMTRGFKVWCHGVAYNSFLDATANVRVNPKREKLTLETLSFRDKIRPGSEQTWSFRLGGSNSRKMEGELLASMYDASLDQFRWNYWNFVPFDYNRSYYSSFNTTAAHSFDVRGFYEVGYQSSYYNPERVYYEQLDWFGFSITQDKSVSVKYLDRLYPIKPQIELPAKIKRTNARNKKAGYIYGTITTHAGEALAGLNIVVKGTTRGTQTDKDGNYTLEAKAKETLVYSMIGYTTLEVELTGPNTIDVIMREEVITLSEIVVVGGGLTVQRRELGNQATTVKTTEYVNPMTGLSGKVPGLLVSEVSGVNPSYRIVLRGQRSVQGSRHTLLILDGVIVPGGTIDKLNADDISSIDVLNGASAAALYGSDAADGALVINTHSGQKKIEAEMAKVNARKIFNETAFFFPHLTTDRSGTISFSFTTPESLTRWKLMLLAHTKDMESAFKTLELKTQKEFMTTVHAPRFLRAGDEIILSAKINNLTQSIKRGNAALMLTDALTGKSINDAFGVKSASLSFQTAGGNATELTWRIRVPQDVQAVQYKVVARSGEFSDGEQNILPVLPDQILVTETLPMYINGGQDKTFVLDKLKTSTSSTLRHHKLTLEFNANPVWYAVQSLPYLMEFPHECAEQTFARYYANLLGAHIVNSNPKIKEIFSRWSNPDALISALEKNPELKSIILQETPWLRDAQNETEQKKRIALLFDLKNMNHQLIESLNKLESMQLSNGGFPWFSGSEDANHYVTQHMVAGFGHLKMLNVKDSVTDQHRVVDKALSFLDREIVNGYQNLLNASERIRVDVADRTEGERKAREYLTEKHISDLQVQYLYSRSFFQNIKGEKELKPAQEYFLKQAYAHWQDFPLYLRGMIAIIAHRNKETELAKTILRSLHENNITHEELGMYWKENTGGYYWQQADIETHALLIETFSVLPPLTTESDKLATIDALKTWLLRNKQVNRWKSTKATTEAIYALLLTGFNWIESSKTLNITLGGEKISPSNAEAGTGLISVSLNNESIKPIHATVSVSKSDPGVAWGALYWQYFENLNSITSSETSIKLSRKIYRVLQDQKDMLTEINENAPVERGDLLRVRIELRSDRDLEFLHLKDMRAAGLEPVDVLSKYKWQNGTSYYQSTRDAATHLFFEKLKAGVYIFEYDVRASASGSFSNGIATIQSMYAPEFSSHSSGIRISIK